MRMCPRAWGKVVLNAVSRWDADLNACDKNWKSSGQTGHSQFPFVEKLGNVPSAPIPPIFSASYNPVKVNLGPIMSRKPPRIHFVVFATAWGSAHGGINSFNRDFCSALAKCLNCAIACVVPSASVDEQKDASDEGVTLLPLGSTSAGKFDVQSASVASEIADFAEVRWWIGHDIVTGEFAAAVRDLSAKKGRLAVIMHQSYEAYAEVKHSIADPGKALRQKNLFEKADESFAVGPLLHKRLIDWSAKGHLIIPGLNIVEHRPAENALKVVVFGRLTKDNALIKGIELAGHSVAEAIKRARVARSSSIITDTLIKFIGTDPHDTYAKTIKHDIETHAGRPVNVSLIPFVSARDLIEHIKGANLSLMLSWHEGFGLTAWESIGAGMPLILSQNSGVYELLKDHGGRARGCVKSIEVLGSSSSAEPFQGSDLEAAASAVLDIARDIKAAIRDAEHLRNFLKEVGYTWESAALKFVHALGQETCLKTSFERPPSSPSRVEGKTQSVESKRQQHAQPKAGTKKTSAMIQKPQFTARPLMDMVTAAGLTAFYPSREYYDVFRSTSGIDAYVSTATTSIVMVSVNLMTGIPFHELCEALKNKLEESSLTVLISLLDFRKPWLMQTMAPALDLKPMSLGNNIVESLEKLWKMKNTLPSATQERFSIRVHQSIPFGSAIMLDHASSNGRIQIETKVPRVALRKSFAFEVGPSGASGFYNMLVSGYLNLISEGQEVDGALLLQRPRA